MVTNRYNKDMLWSRFAVGHRYISFHAVKQQSDGMADGDTGCKTRNRGCIVLLQYDVCIGFGFRSGVLGNRSKAFFLRLIFIIL